MSSDDWSGRTEGAPFLYRWLLAVLRWVPLPLAYVPMALFGIPVVMLVAHKGYIAAYRFFRQRMGYGPLKSFCHVYLNHLRMGEVVVDRFANYAGRRFKFSLQGYDEFCRLCSGESGVMVLSAHVGNYELAGYAFVSQSKPFNALVFGGEQAEVMINRAKMFGNNNIRMIPVGNDMSHVFAINEALSNGEIMSMPGDRLFGSGKSLRCEFFGSKASFPEGPYRVAAMREVPVFTVMVMKRSIYGYDVVIKRIDQISDENKAAVSEVSQASGKTSASGETQATVSGEARASGRKTAGGKRQEREEALCKAYAAELERVVRMYPDQWFNYYDFWK